MTREVTSNFHLFDQGALNGNDNLTGSHHHDGIWTGDGTDHVQSKGGNDAIFLGKGHKEVDAGKGHDTVIFRETEEIYDITINERGRISVNAGETRANLWNVEQILFRNDTQTSHLLITSFLRAGKLNRVQFTRKAPLIASDEGEALLSIGDDGWLRGGRGDDHLIGIGDRTKVFYEGSMFDYAIHRDEEGNLLIRSKMFGTDMLMNIDWLHFSNNTRIQENFIPDEWLGETGFQGIYDTPIDLATAS
ncbi:hypothetical protein [Limoniibacter endophyticus]|uniref:Uncharacterized protein n=1 Tax=Limoniibacter endophyticus TaxID=1565040 RepID=A0A8J3DLN2_9HYPH|nr:hypothetical protein [Limoniibacter endophyticus]GHC60951.1 hypothetical protein GCM10010136_01270 [Limoniibacter endophyticus]